MKQKVVCATCKNKGCVGMCRFQRPERPQTHIQIHKPAA